MRRARYSEALVAACDRARADMESEAAWRRFHAEARADYARLALALMRRWRLPDSVELDDVVQEMFLATPRFVAAWDPARDGARPLVDFVVFNVCDKALKWMHKQRRMSNSKERSRHDLNFSALEADERSVSVGDREAYERWRDDLSDVDRDALGLRLAREEGRALYELLREELDGRELRLFERAVERGMDLDEASRIMYETEPAECLRLRAGRSEAVRRAMSRAVSRAVAIAAEEGER